MKVYNSQGMCLMLKNYQVSIVYRYWESLWPGTSPRLNRSREQDQARLSGVGGGTYSKGVLIKFFPYLGQTR